MLPQFNGVQHFVWARVRANTAAIALTARAYITDLQLNIELVEHAAYAQGGVPCNRVMRPFNGF